MHTLHPAKSSSHFSPKVNSIINKVVIIISVAIILFLLVLASNRNLAINFLGGTHTKDNYAEQSHYVGKIVEIEEDLSGDPFGSLKINVSIEKEKGENKLVTSEVNKADAGFFDSQGKILLKSGDEVILMQTSMSDPDSYYLIDQFRINDIIYLIIIFLVFAVIFAGVKGFASFLGLCFSLLILVGYIVPQIMAGNNPIGVTLIGSGVIGFLSLYLAHGFNKKTTIALISTLISILFALILSSIFISISNLVGMGSEESLFLLSETDGTVNLKGILLSGIIIGTLGVLDDITTAQAAAVEELKLANPKLGIWDLYRRAYNIGKEHIASLVNTLVMAYAGSSFPLFIIIIVTTGTPLWVTLSKEFIVEEVIRTIVGSMTLILAVPITTLIASYVFTKKKSQE